MSPRPRIVWKQVAAGRHECKVDGVLVARAGYTAGSSSKWKLEPIGWYPMRRNGEPFARLDDFERLGSLKLFVAARF